MKFEIFIHCWFFFRFQLCLFVKSLSMSLTCSTGLLIVWAASDLRQLGWAMGSLTRWVNLWKQDLKSPSIISTLNCQCLSCVKHSLVLSVLAALIWPFDRSHLSNFQISNLSQESHSSNQQITLFTKLTNPFLTSSYFEWMALVLAEPAVPVAAEVLVFPPTDAWISQVAYAPANSTTLFWDLNYLHDELKLVHEALEFKQVLNEIKDVASKMQLPHDLHLRGKHLRRRFGFAYVFINYT